ncbi:hypothetical protein [Flavobacterium sp.]|uniref:hypothetical protein n=1 Tax=Flavobacterium sp. TaxID=239 RepID=UPI003528B33B
MRNLENKIEHRKSSIIRSVLLLFSLFFSLYSSSQCAMCRASLQGEEAQAQAEGINNGIVFLMVIPYVLLVVAAYAVYKIKVGKKN